MPSVHIRAQPSERSRYAHNVTRDAARLRRDTKPANRSSITIARRFSPLPSTMPTASSATRCTTGGRSCRARCTRSGVTCSDCHNAHTGKVRAAGNTLCADVVTFRPNTTRRHTTPHAWRALAPPASAATCRRPATWSSIPGTTTVCACRGPDLSVALGTPNACTGCHTNRTASWAVSQVKAWYGHEPQGTSGLRRHSMPPPFKHQIGRNSSAPSPMTARSRRSFGRRPWRISTPQRAGRRSMLWPEACAIRMGSFVWGHSSRSPASRRTSGCRWWPRCFPTRSGHCGSKPRAWLPACRPIN